jgi:hypothetical protein
MVSKHCAGCQICTAGSLMECHRTPSILMVSIPTASLRLSRSSSSLAAPFCSDNLLLTQGPICSLQFPNGNLCAPLSSKTAPFGKELHTAFVKRGLEIAYLQKELTSIGYEVGRDKQQVPVGGNQKEVRVDSGRAGEDAVWLFTFGAGLRHVKHMLWEF